MKTFNGHHEERPVSENMIIVEFSVVPLGTSSTSLSVYVSEAFKEVERSGVKHMLTPMGTIIETDSLEEALEIIKKAHEAVIRAGATRVSTSIKIDDRRDRQRGMEEKVDSVMAKLRSSSEARAGRQCKA
jgi:uncharacterized protein (TIGR00106 family)